MRYSKNSRKHPESANLRQDAILNFADSHIFMP